METLFRPRGTLCVFSFQINENKEIFFPTALAEKLPPLHVLADTIQDVGAVACPHLPRGKEVGAGPLIQDGTWFLAQLFSTLSVLAPGSQKAHILFLNNDRLINRVGKVG